LLGYSSCSWTNWNFSHYTILGITGHEKKTFGMTYFFKSKFSNMHLRWNRNTNLEGGGEEREEMGSEERWGGRG
jgi:hypothetical protein